MPLRPLPRLRGRAGAGGIGIVRARPLPTPPPQAGRERRSSGEQVAPSRNRAAADAPARRWSTTTGSSQLTLRAHPASFLRADLAARGIIRNEDLRTRRTGERVAVSGLVTIRQRPGSAQGVIFMTIEDETAIANIIVWPKTFERFRPVVLGARYIAVTGEMQKESDVIHVVARPARRPDAAARAPDRQTCRRSSRWPAPTRSSARTTRTSTAARAAAAIRRASPHPRMCRTNWRAISTCRRAAARMHPRGAAATGDRARRYGYGTMPSRPTLTRLASKVPSGFFSAAHDRDVGARLEFVPAADHIAADHRVGSDDDLLLAVLVFHHDDLAVDAGHGGVDRGVGHGACRARSHGRWPSPVPRWLSAKIMIWIAAGCRRPAAWRRRR